MMETATILNHASRRSLVILDELGRGTSTFDGTAIAYAVLEHIRKKIDCLCLFSTHYHLLISEYEGMDSEVDKYHMKCIAQPRVGGGWKEGAGEEVTFLYQYVKGKSEKSFGMNVATMAGLPKEVVGRAREVSERFEKKLLRAHGRAEERKRKDAGAYRVSEVEKLLAQLGVGTGGQ